MGSTDRAVREKQLKKAQEIFEARKSRLGAAGIEGKEQTKDPVLRNLAAALKKAKARIAAIDEAEKHVRETAEKDVKVKKEAADKAKGKAKAAQGGGKPKKEKPTEKPKEESKEKKEK
jgi:hypothetical protein